MADVTITYAGNEIAAMNDTGTKTLETQGKYCTDDITVSYTKSGGGGGGPYTVSVSLGNPQSPGSFVSCTIYDATFTGGILTKGSQLGAITSPTGSTSVTVSAPANALWIDLVGGYINWSPYDAIYSAGGGTALMAHNSTIFNGGSSVYGVYVVIDNGNINMDWIDWDD